jgi:hypothetical protein
MTVRWFPIQNVHPETIGAMMWNAPVRAGHARPGRGRMPLVGRPKFVVRNVCSIEYLYGKISGAKNRVISIKKVVSK